MASILRAKASLKGRDKTSLCLNIRKSGGSAPAVWASFKKNEELSSLSSEALQARIGEVTGEKAEDLLLLAGLSSSQHALEVLAHHVIMEANNAPQRPAGKKVCVCFHGF